MTAPIVFQCDWLGPIVVIVDKTEMAQDEATRSPMNVELKNVAGRSVYVYTNGSTGRCTLSLAGSTATTTFRCDDAAWHLLELKGDFGSSTMTVDWRIDGAALRHGREEWHGGRRAARAVAVGGPGRGRDSKLP